MKPPQVWHKARAAQAFTSSTFFNSSAMPLGPLRIRGLSPEAVYLVAHSLFYLVDRAGKI